MPGFAAIHPAEDDWEEVFAVLEGTLTLLLGDPAERETLPPGAVAAVAPREG